MEENTNCMNDIRTFDIPRKESWRRIKGPTEGSWISITSAWSKYLCELYIFVTCSHIDQTKNEYTKVIFLCEQKTLHTYSSKAFIYYASLGTKEFNPQTGHTVICKRKQTHKQANRLQGKCVYVCVCVPY